jgi:Xaa-Pro dipeptidase
VSAGTATEAEARLERLAQAVAAAELDALLATSDESIAYLTGFRPLQLERFFGVVVRAGGSGAVLVPKLDAGQVADAPAVLDRVVYDATSNGMPELLATLAGATTVGVEEDHLVFARARALAAGGFEVLPRGRLVLDLRIAKDAAEVERIRAASALVADAIAEAFRTLRPGDVEREVNARVASWLRERGATDSHPLILFGEDAANPHAEPGPRELRAGDVVCADVSACLDGYWGDLTRCATVGPASEWAREAWALVAEAQAAAIAAATAGAAARDVDAAQRAIVTARPDLGECLHGAGHAMGLAIHEPPFLVPASDDVLVEGTVLTIEPGLYQPGTGGIRLEDDVLVTKDGPVLLSELPLELVQVG